MTGNLFLDLLKEAVSCFSLEDGMANLVGEKGQLVIEKPIRDALGIQPGFVAVQSVVGDHLEIRFYPPEHRRSLHGSLAKYVKGAISQEEWPEVCEQAWAGAVREDSEE